MARRRNSFKGPPAPRELDIVAVWPCIEAEARRQVDSFYPVMHSEALARTRKTIEFGILNMMKRGAARLVGGVIEFWNPVEGEFQQYDQAYNELMLGFMRDFKSRYRDGMRSKASLN